MSLSPEHSQAVAIFVNKSARPLFNYRMAGAISGSDAEARVRSAKTRFRNAEQELHELILEFVTHAYPNAQLDG